MAGTVKFVVDAEAGKAIQEFLRLRSAEKGVTDGLKEVATSARVAETAVAQSAQRATREYELAGRAASRAIPLPRTAGGAYLRRSRGDGFDVSPLASSTLRAPAAGVPLTSSDFEYSLRRTADESAGRVLKAHQLRAARAEVRRSGEAFDSTLGPAVGNLTGMDQLLARGRSAVDASHARSAANRSALEAAQERAHATEDVHRQIAMNNFSTGVAKRQQRRDDVFDGLTKGLALTGVAIAAVSEVTEKYTAHLDEAAVAGVQFDNDLKPLLSLGNNRQHTAALQDKVRGLSGSLGIDTGQAASSLFMLQSAGANFSGKQRDDILGASAGLNRVVGGELQTDLIAVTKLMQTYGKELGTADVAASKLMATEDQAAITLQELAELIPDVLPAAKLMGHTYDEVAAAVITATQHLGNNEKTLTGVRNMFLKLGEAQQKGIIHQGRFIDQLQELHDKASAVELEQIFGERAVATVAALADSTGDVARNLDRMAAVKGGEVFGKFLDRQRDPVSRDADTVKSLDEGLKNVPGLRFNNPEIRDQDIRLKAARVGYEANVSPLLDSVVPNYAKNLQLGLAATASANFASSNPIGGGMTYANQDWVQYGFNQLIDDKLKAGDAQSVFDAHALKLRYGTDTGNYIQQKDGTRHYTNEQDAQEYTELSQGVGRDVGLKKFEGYRRAELDGDSAGAAKILAEMRADAKAAGATPGGSTPGAGDKVADKMGSAADKLNSAADKLLQFGGGGGGKNPNAHTF